MYKMPIGYLFPHIFQPKDSDDHIQQCKYHNLHNVPFFFPLLFDIYCKIYDLAFTIKLLLFGAKLFLAGKYQPK